MLPNPLTHIATSLNIPQDVDLIVEPISDTIVRVINWGLGIAGAVAVLLLIVGGFMYITASGDSARLEKAKAVLKGSIVGIVIILISAIIVFTVNFAITRGGTTGGTGRTTPPGSTAPPAQFGNGMTYEECTDPAAVPYNEWICQDIAGQQRCGCFDRD